MFATAHLGAMTKRGDLGKWCCSPAKRAFDFFCALMLLLLALPFLLAIAIAVQITSRGPVLFRQLRVGKKGRQFTLLKFRTMAHNRRDPGPSLTGKDDLRITALGRILRHWKLDELPQLINVVRGDMSFVGPRPDLPEFYETLEVQYREILLQRPGLTGSASLRFRTEEELFAGLSAEESRLLYVTSILPAKVCMDLEYARSASFISDVHLIGQTLASCFVHRHPRRSGSPA